MKIDPDYRVETIYLFFKIRAVIQMEAYIQASEQIKSDLISEYAELHEGVTPEKVLRASLNGTEVLTNVEAAIRSSAKNKFLSKRGKGLKKYKLDDDDLVQLYITTDDEETYNDGLNSISCSKNILYFLFVMRYENFGITERRKFSDSLNQCERNYPKQSINIYNNKKQMVDYMDSGDPTYKTIQPIVKQYLVNIRLFLVAQLKIYGMELSLCKTFCKYLKETMEQDFFQDKKKANSSTIKALVKLFKAMEKRGVEMPKYKKKITSETVGQVVEQLEEQLLDLKSETGVIHEVTAFIEDVVKYMEDPTKQVDPSEEKAAGADTKSLGFIEMIKEEISSAFAEWLNK